MQQLITKFKHYFLIIILSLTITAFFLLHVVGVTHWRFITELESFLYDTRVLLTMPGGEDQNIVIVDIDEKSLGEIGRWPWGRDRLAHLVNELFDYYQIGVLGFDIVFPETDESSGLRILEQLAKEDLADIPGYMQKLADLRQRLDFDQLFINSLHGRPVVLGYYFNAVEEGGTAIRAGHLPAPSLTREDFKNRNILAKRAVGYGSNIKEFQDNAVASGHFSTTTDDDGVIRRVPMLYEFEGNYYESLAIAMVRVILGVERIDPDFVEDNPFGESGYSGLEKLRLDFHTIPIDNRIQTLVPFRGTQGSFRYISAADIMQGRINKEVLAGKIVLVGTTAPGLYDLRATPVQEVFPGVEVHANLIAGILERSIKERPAYADGAEFVFLLITGIFLAFILPLLSPVWLSIVFSSILLFHLCLNYFFWQFQNLVLPLSSIILLMLTIFLVNVSHGFFVERRGKRQLSNLFGQYVPQELVDEMSVDPGSYTQLAQNREMTVLFSDVRNFTSISEGLSPQDLSNLMNEYLTPMTRLIYDNRGTIDKYIGDALMAFWGAPVVDPRHPRHALVTGLAMLERLNAIREEFQERGWPEIRIGIGINTGVMSVGDMGSEYRMAYTVLGDAVNLGSRLEGLTKNYGVEIIVSESTKTAVTDFVYRELDVVRVKGKEEPIAIYEPLALVSEVSEEELEEIELHEQALKNYRSQDWETAERQYKNLQRRTAARKLYQIYLERIAEFRVLPPGDEWDGVYEHLTK